jgi:hypothetical protein
MKALPVFGALVLGAALSVLIPGFRQTRPHVHRSKEGKADFALEIPRNWTHVAAPGQGGLEIVEGRLPSGLKASLFMEGSTWRARWNVGADSPARTVEEGGRVEVSWVRDGWSWRLGAANPLPAHDSAAGYRVFTLDLAGPGAGFSASVAVLGRPTDEDCALLERCLRSVCWIGR